MSTLFDDLNLQDQELNTKLGLIKPLGLTEDEDELYDEFFDLVRQDFQANRIKIEDISKILNLFNKKDNEQKTQFIEKIYQSNFAPKIKDTLIEKDNPENTSTQNTELISWDDYQKQIQEFTNDLTPEQKDLFEYIHYSELAGEPIDPVVQDYLDYINATPEERAQMDQKYAQLNETPEDMAQARIAQAMNKRRTLNLKQNNTPNSESFNKPFTVEDIQQIIES